MTVGRSRREAGAEIDAPGGGIRILFRAAVCALELKNLVTVTVSGFPS
jgi:hypothetical protein